MTVAADRPTPEASLPVRLDRTPRVEVTPAPTPEEAAALATVLAAALAGQVLDRPTACAPQPPAGAERLSAPPWDLR